MHKTVPTNQEKIRNFIYRHSLPVKSYYIHPIIQISNVVPKKEWERDCFYEDIDIALIQSIVTASRKRVKALLTKNNGDLVKTVLDIQDGK